MGGGARRPKRRPPGGSASPGPPPPPLRPRHRVHRRPLPPVARPLDRPPRARLPRRRARLPPGGARPDPGPGVTLLHMCVPYVAPFSLQESEFRGRVSALFHAAATLSPLDLRFLVGEKPGRLYVEVAVPRFHRAASIELRGLDLAFADPRSTWLGFPALERLSLTMCRANLTDLVLRCPCLRFFRLREDHGSQHMNIIIRSSSLQELDVDTRIPFTYRIDIRAPALKRLLVSFATSAKITVLVSVLAPLLETVSWRCSYSTVSARLGLWGLSAVRLQTAENDGHGGHLPPIHMTFQRKSALGRR